MPNLTAAPSTNPQCSRVQPLHASQRREQPQLHVAGLSQFYTQFSSTCLHSWRQVPLPGACAMPRPIHSPTRCSPSRWLGWQPQQSLLRRRQPLWEQVQMLPAGDGQACARHAQRQEHTKSTHRGMPLPQQKPAYLLSQALDAGCWSPELHQQGRCVPTGHHQWLNPIPSFYHYCIPYRNKFCLLTKPRPNAIHWPSSWFLSTSYLYAIAFKKHLRVFETSEQNTQTLEVM